MLGTLFKFDFDDDVNLIFTLFRIKIERNDLTLYSPCQRSDFY